MAPKKRRLRAEDAEQLVECLAAEAATSIHAVRCIWNRAASVPGGAQVVEERELRAVDAARLARAKSVLVRQELPPEQRDGAPVPIYVANPAGALRLAVEYSPAWASAVEGAMDAAEGAPLQMVIYHISRRRHDRQHLGAPQGQEAHPDLHGAAADGRRLVSRRSLAACRVVPPRTRG